jgi:hypothetical protein
MVLLLLAGAYSCGQNPCRRGSTECELPDSHQSDVRGDLVADIHSHLPTGRLPAHNTPPTPPHLRLSDHLPSSSIPPPHWQFPHASKTPGQAQYNVTDALMMCHLPPSGLSPWDEGCVVVVAQI